jgi:hypothetical protein
VLPTTDFQVELNDVTSELTAGGLQSAFTVTYRDRFGNLTDSTVGAVIVRPTVGTDRDTIPMTRLAKGEYRAERTPFTKAGTYLVTIAGINAANIRGDSAFTVVPDAASKAVFQSVPVAINFGALLPVFTVRYRDRFDNPTDFDGEVRYSNINSVLVRSGLMPQNSGRISTNRTSFSVSTASVSAPINVAGEYSFLIDGITTVSGTSSFLVRSLPAASVQFVNVQERVPEGKTIPPFSVIYRDRVGNITDYNGTVTFRNIANSAINGTIRMYREATGVSTATANIPFAVAGTYHLSVSGLTITSGATTVIVTSTSGVTQTRFWETPSSVIAGTPLDSFYVAFLNTNAEYKNFDSALVRYTHSSGNPSGVFALTRLDTGIYKTNTITLTKAGTYRLTVDNIAVTTGTSSLTVLPDTIIAQTVIDSLQTEAFMGETIAPFYITHTDRFENLIVTPPQATTFFVSNNRGDSASITPTAVTPRGALYVPSHVFSSTGSFQIQAEHYRQWSGNRRIQVYAPKPIITAISPPTLVVGSNAIVTIIGRNFAENCTVYFGEQQVSVERLEPNRLQVFIHRLLIDSTRRDSLVVVNDNSPFGRSNMKGVATLTNSASIQSVEPSKARIDDSSFTMKIVVKGLADVIKNVFYKIQITNTLGVSRDFEASSEKDTIFVEITGIGKSGYPADALNTVRQFRDLGSGTHSISVINGTTKALLVPSVSNVFFIENPSPRITKLTDRSDDEISRNEPFDIQNTSFISDGWLTMKIRGRGLVRSPFQSTITVAPLSNVDSLCSVEVLRVDSIYYGNNSSITVRMKIGDNIIAQGSNKQDYKLIVRNEAFPNRTIPTAGSPQNDGGGSAEILFSIEDTGPEIISFNPPVVRAAFDTTRTILIRVKRFQQNSQLWFKNPSRDSLRVPYELVNDSTLRVQITLSQIGDYLVRIIGPNNTSSRYARLRVGNPYPLITSITPIVSTIGQDAQFRIEGRGFTDDTRIRLNNGIEWMRIDTRLLSNQSRQTLTMTIREPLVTYGRQRLTVYNDTTFGVGGFDTTSIVISSILPHIDSLRPRAAEVGRTTSVVIYGRNLSSQTKILVTGFPSDSLLGVYSPPVGSRAGSITISIPGTRIQNGANLLYAANPGNYASPENGTLLGVSSSSYPRIIRLEPNNLKPQNRDTIVRIIGRNFDSTSQVFCYYLTGTPRLMQIISPKTDSLLLVSVPKDLINRNNVIPFTVVKNDIASDQVLLTVNSFLPTITGILTEYVTRVNKISSETFLGGGIGEGVGSSRIDSSGTLYAGTYSVKLRDQVQYVPVLFPIGLFPVYRHQIVQYEYQLTGFDLAAPYNLIIKQYLDGKPFNGRPVNYLKGESQFLGSYSTLTHHIYFHSYYSQQPQYAINKPVAYGFLLSDSLTVGTHTIQGEFENGIKTNLYTFTVQARPTTHIERLELEEPFEYSGSYRSKPFSTLNYTIPTDTVKYIYVIAPVSNAAFTNLSIVKINNQRVPARFINHGVLRVRVTPEFIQNGVNSLVVENPGGFSTPTSIQNFNAEIKLHENQSDSRVTGIEPIALLVGNQDTTITVRGIGFTRYMNVLLRHTVQTTTIDSLGNEVPDWGIEETPLEVSNVSYFSMRVTIPARFRNSITIDTLIIGHLRWGRRSDTVFLPIVPRLSILSVQPNVIDVDIPGEPIQRDTLIIRGSGFDANTSIYTGQDYLTIIRQTDTLLQALSSSFLHSYVRNTDISVYNGSTLARSIISVQYPRPIFESMTPRNIEVISPAFIAVLEDKFGSSFTAADNQADNFHPVAGVEEIITEPKLYPNAPNPFDSQTQITYRLPYKGMVKLDIIDRLGTVVAALVHEQQQEGSHSLVWNPQALPSGTYYTRLTVIHPTKGTVTQKLQHMTLIR